ncbi:MAG: hypothetical protein J6Q48_01425 [Bacteroidaceae bacterium]|nr:hypothetical protein [Bacteroidaceae bacterium]
MSTTQKRTLTITCTEGNEVTKKQLTCFVHNLIADVKKTRPLVVWKRDPKSKAGENTYYTNGLAAGSYITLKDLGDGQGIEMTYSRHGDLVYKAFELYGVPDCDMHIASLLKNVATAVRVTEMLQPRSPLAETMNAIKAQYPKPAEEFCIAVRDVFRSIDVDMLVQETLDTPSMLSYAIARNSPERARIEALIRATVSYIQNVKPKETGFLVQGIGLQSLPDKKFCASLKSASLAQIANSYVKFPDYNYGGLHPDQRNLKFAKDFIVNLLEGV